MSQQFIFSHAFPYYEKGLTIKSVVTGISYHNSAELRQDGENVDDVTSWFMPREVRGLWTVEELRTYKMHYILCDKYDLIFSVTATSEKDAKVVAEKEMKEDGIINVDYLECS